MSHGDHRPLRRPIDGTRTYYDECGEGMPFIGVHTAGADAREYQYLLPLMASGAIARSPWTSPATASPTP